MIDDVRASFFFLVLFCFFFIANAFDFTIVFFFWLGINLRLFGQRIIIGVIKASLSEKRKLKRRKEVLNIFEIAICTLSTHWPILEGNENISLPFTCCDQTVPLESRAFAKKYFGTRIYFCLLVVYLYVSYNTTTLSYTILYTKNISFKKEVRRKNICRIYYSKNKTETVMRNVNKLTNKRKIK